MISYGEGCLGQPATSQSSIKAVQNHTIPHMSDLGPYHDREDFTFHEDFPAHSTGNLRKKKSLRDHEVVI
jgi:hypothetical protein